MKKLRAQNELLATQIQTAIDEGKDASEEEPSIDGRKKPRIYRRTVPFTHIEALQIALDALQAYFVEQPLFINEAADNFAKAAIGRPSMDYGQSRSNSDERELVILERQDNDKQLEIELHTETQISREGDEIFALERIPRQSIEDQQLHIKQLRTLMDFSGE
jgi:hypothetical protein